MNNQLQTTNQQNGIASMTPKSLDEALRFADMMSKSEIVPKDYQGKPANIMVAVQWGMELGLHPFQAMQNIALINGRPSLWGDSILALVQGSGLVEDFHEEVTDRMATCRIVRKGISQPFVRTFSMEDARVAGLAGKQGPWKQYPKRMMQMRARAWALRDGFADVLRGIPCAEEVRDIQAHEQEGAKTNAARLTALVSDDSVAQTTDDVDVVTLAEVLDYINGAENMDALSSAGEIALSLSDEGDKQEARAAYAAKQKEIKASAEAKA